MALVHMILQGANGVGKSFAAVLLAQHYKGRNIETVCFDTDPVDSMFASYRALGAQPIQIVKDKGFDPRAFGGLIETVMKMPARTAVVIDTGASTFETVCSHLLESEAVPFLNKHGHKVALNTMVAGGMAQRRTLEGFADLCRNFPNVPVVVWLNEFFGPVEGPNGSRFDDFKVCRENAGRIVGTVMLPVVEDLFGYNIAQMMKARLTFDEAIASPEFDILAAQRLTMFRRWVEEAMQLGLRKLDEGVVE